MAANNNYIVHDLMSSTTSTLESVTLEIEAALQNILWNNDLCRSEKKSFYLMWVDETRGVERRLDSKSHFSLRVRTIWNILPLR